MMGRILERLLLGGMFSACAFACWYAVGSLILKGQYLNAVWMFPLGLGACVLATIAIFDTGRSS